MLSPTRLGTAQWTEPAAFEQGFLYGPGAIWLGRSLTPASPPVGVADDRHVLLVAGTRSGKGATVIVNNLCLWPGSAVVIDPKGENATLTAARRGRGSAHCDGLGQIVHVLDPYGIAKVDPALRKRFNPLDVFDISKSTCPKDVTRLVIALIPLSATEDNWSERAARRLLYGVILHVLTAPEFERRRNLITVRDLIHHGDVEMRRQLENTGESDVPAAFSLLWAGMIQNPAFSGEVAAQGTQFRDVQNDAPKQWSAVHDDAVNALHFINNDSMRNSLSYSDFRLADLKRDPKGVTVYLCMPEDYLHEDFRWLRTIVSLVTSELRAESGPPASGHAVLMLLDEFPTLQRMDSIETGIATMAGYGLKFFFVVQDFSQLKRHYREWETFAGNCGVKIAFGVEDNFTRDYISKLIGETELMRVTRNISEARADGVTVTRGTSETWGTSTNESTARSRGKNRNRSWGGSKGTSSSNGQSEGASWTPTTFFRSLQGNHAWLRDNETVNKGQSQERGQNRGSNWGGSSGTNQGITRTSGTGTSHSYSTNESESISHTVTNTAGLTETLQRRALLAPDEVGRFFTRAKNPDDPTYPGWGLVLLAGMNPVAVQRVHYFDDPIFARCFDPHPDHPLLPLQQRTIHPPEWRLLCCTTGMEQRISFRLLVEEGSRVTKGTPFVSIDLESLRTTLEAFRQRLRVRCKMTIEDLARNVTFVSPVTGYVVRAGNAKSSQGYVTGGLQGLVPADVEPMSIVVAHKSSPDTAFEEANTTNLTECMKRYAFYCILHSTETEIKANRTAGIYGAVAVLFTIVALAGGKWAWFVVGLAALAVVGALLYKKQKKEIWKSLMLTTMPYTAADAIAEKPEEWMREWLD